MTSSQVLTFPPPSAISRTVQTQGQKGKVRTHAEPLSSAISVLCVHNVTPAGVGQNFVVTVPRNSIPTHPPEYYDLLKHLLYHQYCVFAIRQIEVNSVTFWAVKCKIISLHMEAMLRLKFTKYEESNLQHE